MDKRSFLKSAAGFASIPFLPLNSSFLETPPAIELASVDSDEELWKTVRSHYELKKDYINLESGYYNIIPKPTLDHFIDHIKHVNLQGSYYMRNYRFEDNRAIANELADLVGCDGEELAITRNTTESLDLIIAGYPWKKGDEAIYAIQDYGAMQEMFKQVAKRHGIVNKVVSVPNHPKSDEEIVALYEDQITENTKLIMVCHMINITGHILPVKKICDMAHGYGVDVLVDGAHCIGHIDFNISDLNCDFYGSSLHKWLATPLGLGLLYVRKEKMPQIWPLLGSHAHGEYDIRRINHIGTCPVHSDLAIRNAISYIKWIGVQRKEARLRTIQNRWTNALRDFPNVVINTPKESQRSCGIANVGIKTIKPRDLAKRLLEEHQIFTVGIEHHNVQGCRITPNVFTTFEEVDKFIAAIKKIARES